MLVWNLLQYVESSGAAPFLEWLESLELGPQGFIAARFNAMRKMAQWPEKWGTKMKGWDGLIEIRITYNKVQYRPIGIYQPGRKFILLGGAIEKKKIKSDTLNAISVRRNSFLENPHRVIPYEPLA